MDWKHIIYPVMTHFRRQRLAELLKAFPNLEECSVLDVGGRPFVWDLLKKEYGVTPKSLVILNTPSEELLPESPDYTVVIADGRELPYPDNSFDLVFSNSVIEHVGNYDQMTQFAKECDRVGRSLYVQTPNHWFPLEAHFGTALIHWLPRAWYQKLSFLSLRYLFAHNNPKEKGYFQQEFDTTYLLSAKQLKQLFPGKTVMSEKVMGLSKSFVVMSPQPQVAAEPLSSKVVQPIAPVKVIAAPAAAITSTAINSAVNP